MKHAYFVQIVLICGLFNAQSDRHILNNSENQTFLFDLIYCDNSFLSGEDVFSL